MNPLVLDETLEDGVVGKRVWKYTIEGHSIEHIVGILDHVTLAQLGDNGVAHDTVGDKTTLKDHDLPQRKCMNGVVVVDEDVKGAGKEVDARQPVIVFHDLQKFDGLVGLFAANEGHKKRLERGHGSCLPADADDHLAEGVLSTGDVACALPALKQDIEGVGIRGHAGLDAVEEVGRSLRGEGIGVLEESGN